MTPEHFRIGTDALPRLERLRLRTALWSCYPSVRMPWRLPSWRSVAGGICVAAVLALGLRSAVIAYAYASTTLTRSDLLYPLRRNEELRRLATMDMAMQRALYFLFLSERRMHEAVLSTQRRIRPPLALVDRAAAAQRSLIAVHGDVPAGLVLESERAFARAMELYALTGGFQRKLGEHAVRSRAFFREAHTALRAAADRHHDAVLGAMLDAAERADAFYHDRLIMAEHDGVIDAFWLDPVAAGGWNREILDAERTMRLLPPATPEGGR